MVFGFTDLEPSDADSKSVTEKCPALFCGDHETKQYSREHQATVATADRLETSWRSRLVLAPYILNNYSSRSRRLTLLYLVLLASPPSCSCRLPISFTLCVAVFVGDRVPVIFDLYNK